MPACVEDVEPAVMHRRAVVRGALAVRRLPRRQVMACGSWVSPASNGVGQLSTIRIVSDAA